MEIVDSTWKQFRDWAQNQAHWFCAEETILERGDTDPESDHPVEVRIFKACLVTPTADIVLARKEGDSPIALHIE